MSRTDPFAFAFSEVARERFPAIRAEAEGGRTDTSDRMTFAALPTAQRVLADLEEPHLLAQRPEAAAEYVTVLYVAYRYWLEDRPLVRLDRVRLDRAFGRAPAGAPRLRRTACYVQLPERVVWAQIAPESPHEPLDGFFVARSTDGSAWTVVGVLGLRPDREGFSQVTAVAGPDDFVAAAGEARTPPFAPVMEGGERAGVYSIVSVAELLLLAALALADDRA